MTGNKVKGLSIKKLALVNPAAISQGMMKMEGRLSGESGLREAIEKMGKALTRKRRAQYSFTCAWPRMPQNPPTNHHMLRRLLLDSQPRFPLYFTHQKTSLHIDPYY